LARPAATLAFAPGVEESEADDDFAIDEASRVVRLPLPPPDSLGQARPVNLVAPGLPGVDTQVGRGSGSHGSLSNGDAVARAVALNRTALLSRTAPQVVPLVDGQPAPVGAPQAAPARRKRTSGTLLLIGGAAVLIAGLVVFLLRLAQPGDGSATHVARSSAPTDDLAVQEFDPLKPKAVASQPTSSGRPRSKSPRVTKPGGDVATTEASGGHATSDLLDIPGAGGAGNATTAQVIEEVTNQATKSSILFTRCYENALKHDPLLSVPKATATVTVVGGKVTDVAIPSLKGSSLGGCLTAMIKHWRFPKASESVSTQLPIVFSRH
jgi:hypothetical protein